LPFDVFKIDRSFVDKLTNREDEHGRVIVKTILGMANSLNYETVAEGQWYSAWNKQDESVVAAMMRQGSAA